MSKYIKVNNSNIFYKVDGMGEAIVLVHGNFNDSRVWEYQIRYLSKCFRVISYDQRGYGNSDIPTSLFSPYEDLKALLDSLEVKKTIIIGSSSGGSIVIDFALKYPEYVKSLILVAPSLNGYRFPLKLMIEAMKNIFMLKSKGFEVAVEKFINNPYWEYFFPMQHRKEAREKVLEMVRTQKNFYSWDLNLAIPLKPYACKRIGELLIPALIVLPEKDSISNIKVGEYIHKSVEKSKKVIISDCGHLPFIEKPEEFTQTVLEFLKGS